MDDSDQGHILFNVWATLTSILWLMCFCLNVLLAMIGCITSYCGNAFQMIWALFLGTFLYTPALLFGFGSNLAFGGILYGVWIALGIILFVVRYRDD